MKGDHKIAGQIIKIDLSDIAKLYLRNESEILNSKKITEDFSKDRPFPKEFDLIKFLEEFLITRQRVKGMGFNTPYGITYLNPGSECFYRGENELFPISLPSFIRDLDGLNTDDPNIIKAYDLVNQLRNLEFYRLIFKFNIVKIWPQYCGGSILYEQLAQHYGLKTRHLDITDDFKVALFFACCYWDEEKERFFPLTKAQTDINEGKRYGVIYIKRKELDGLDIIHLPGVNNFLIGAVPIGFQPFYRCVNQNGYTIKMTEHFSLLDDYKFDKLIFEHNVYLSNWIFQLMDRGNKIYPVEGLNRISKTIKSINEIKEFSNEALEALLENNSEFRSREELIKFLDDNYPDKIEFSDNFEIEIDSNIIKQINDQYQKDIDDNQFPVPEKLFMDPRLQRELDNL